MLEELNLRAWPFQVVPDGDFAKVWAGRRSAKEQINGLLRRMQISPKSSLRLLWANFGMGKTHTLLHIKHLCSQTGNTLIPIYAVMPNRPASFLDIYRAIVSELPYEFLGEQLVKVGYLAPGGVALHPMFARTPGLVNALLAMRSGEIERTTAARQWLSAQPGLGSRELRTLGVSYRIKTAEDAIQALTALTKLAVFNAKTPAKLVVLLDEYQRIGELKTNTRAEINAGMHGYFNANPSGLEMFLSFSFGRQENVAYLLSGELKSRAAPETLNLDVLSKVEALEFLRELLDKFRLRLDGNWAYPLTPEAMESMVEHIARTKALTPRRLMLYGDHVLQQSIVLRENDPTCEITSQVVHRWLSDPALGSLDMDEPAQVAS
jgi:hypothetical protein